VTTLKLLVAISVALLLQLAAGVGFALWRRRRGRPAPRPVEGLPSPGTSLAWSSWRDFRIARRDFEDAAQTQCSLCLEPVDGAPLPSFKPGQFLTFRFQVTDAATGVQGQTIVRCYSLSDQPSPQHYRVTVKRVLAPANRENVPPGLASNHIHDRLRVGELVTVKAPAGQFFIGPDPALPVVLIAGGIGITPMMSMLHWCLGKQPGRSLHLYYGVRNRAVTAFKSTLESLAASHPTFRLNIVYSHPEADDVRGREDPHAGHVNIELLRRTLPQGPHDFYVCGPPPMMESLVPALRQWGVPERNIHFEAFGPASLRSAEAATTGRVPGTSGVEVRFRRSGRALVWDGQDANLLDFAERHGVIVDAGCRSGSCGSCETKLLSGTIGYAHQPDHELAPGQCLLCVGTPESALELEA